MLSVANRLVEPIKILIIVGIAYSLATAGWYLISGPTPAPLDDAKSSTAATDRAAGKPALSVSDIVALGLFGKAKDAGAGPAVFDAPETRLRLTLEGVFQAETPEESAAIIAEQGKPGELFLVGGKMPGNATLTEVHADRIVLRRGTVFETLRFSDEPSLLTAGGREDTPIAEQLEPSYEEPQETQNESGEASIEASPTDDGAPAAIGAVVQSYRERLQQDPVGTLNALGVAPVAASGAQGYRVDSLAASPYLAQTGLQAGDVVLSVNGRPVGDIQTDQAEIDNIVAQGSARLEVQRGTRRFFVTTSLK